MSGNSFRKAIGTVMPKWLKSSFLWLYNRPARIKYRLLWAALDGTLPCPDKLYLKWMFGYLKGKKLNLEHPVSFQDKLNWLKLYYHNPLYTKLVDKYSVKEWVSEKIGAEYIVPVYGVYDKFDDIDFDNLPEQFVLKCTHDSGSVVIVKDKSRIDLSAARAKIEKGLATKQFYISREWPYKNVKPRIVCEQFIEDDESKDAPDYKFFCFDGTPRLLTYNMGRNSEEGLKIDIYDDKWNLLDASIEDYPRSGVAREKPKDLDKMLELSKTLSKGMPFVRVDFMYANNKVYFSEFTFFPSGALWHLFQPYDFNVELGKMLILPERMV